MHLEQEGRLMRAETLAM